MSFVRPKPRDSQKTLLNLYEQNNNSLKTGIKEKNPDHLRIMTWNVHYWSKIVADNSPEATKEAKEYPNHRAILEEINLIKPDIVCMQEVNYGKTDYIDADLNEELGKIGYILVSFCNTTPSWFVVPYGNAIIVRKDLLWCGPNSNPLSCNNVNQRNNIYKNNSQGKSTKCYIETIYKNIKFICTHLDVHDNTGVVREAQINELDEYIGTSCPTIIFGDFNLISENDYKETLVDSQWYEYLKTRGNNGSAFNLIKSKGWVDSFEVKGTKPPYTTWNSTRVDFIFFKNFDKIPGINLQDLINDSFVFYTTNSDHIPVIVDLDKTIIENISTNSLVQTENCGKVKFYLINY